MTEEHRELDHLFWKDEILQAMYWLLGEGLGKQVRIDRLATLLGTNSDTITRHITILAADNYLEGDDAQIALTEFGRKEAAARFASAFQGLQKAGHGECGPDCDCQWEGKDQCQHQHIH